MHAYRLVTRCAVTKADATSVQFTLPSTHAHYVRLLLGRNQLGGWEVYPSLIKSQLEEVFYRELGVVDPRHRCYRPTVYFGRGAIPAEHKGAVHVQVVFEHRFKCVF